MLQKGIYGHWEIFPIYVMKQCYPTLKSLTYSIRISLEEDMMICNKVEKDMGTLHALIWVSWNKHVVTCFCNMMKWWEKCSLGGRSSDGMEEVFSREGEWGWSAVTQRETPAVSGGPHLLFALLCTESATSSLSNNMTSVNGSRSLGSCRFLSGIGIRVRTVVIRWVALSELYHQVVFIKHSLALMSQEIGFSFPLSFTVVFLSKCRAPFLRWSRTLSPEAV